MIDLVPRLLVGILPVLVFLAGLVYLDSYKLVPPRWIAVTIAVGDRAPAPALPSSASASAPISPTRRTNSPGGSSSAWPSRAPS